MQLRGREASWTWHGGPPPGKILKHLETWKKILDVIFWHRALNVLKSLPKSLCVRVWIFSNDLIVGQSLAYNEEEDGCDYTMKK